MMERRNIDPAARFSAASHPAHRDARPRHSPGHQKRLKGGHRSALLTSLGVVGGLFVWTGASAVGVAILLEEEAFAFILLKFAGAAYLTYLGVRALLSIRNEKKHPGSASGKSKDSR
jgi:threonine/homoserine/homoserine lactone efflux protein